MDPTRKATLKGSVSGLVNIYIANPPPVPSTQYNTPAHCFQISISSYFLSFINKYNMISPKKLIRMARKWQKVAAIRRKRISLPRSNGDIFTDTNSRSSLVADKGHFVVYTEDQRRFVFPIVYLNNDIFRDLLKLSEEEFGLPSDGPITLPVDAVFMDYVVSLIQRHTTKEIQNALLMSIENSRCSMPCSLHQEKPCQQLLICSF
ncbi:auxin-responsive protein SAUR67-like [Actinidia eriantha]|uniref:auxin-responsive protein SAUR67-like n=1 Tax=Actinidia eriantha TaxID=165200 RepID=UPI00258BB747|nr:auxin-responsive protein SAUR67-like [Actinidia eriantha]